MTSDSSSAESRSIDTSIPAIFDCRKSIPRVLFILDNLTISGAEKVAINLLRHATAADLPIEGFVYMDDLVGADQCGGRIRALRGSTGGSFGQRLGRAVSRIPTLSRVAKSFDILVPVTPPAVPWAVAAGLTSGAKVVPWVHYDLDGMALEPFASGRALRDDLMNMLHSKVIPAFDELFFVSQSVLDSVARAHGRAKPGWRVLPNVYDSTPLTDVASLSANALDRDKRENPHSERAILLFLGRICHTKRWEEALHVAELLHARGYPFELHFIGDGPQIDALREAIALSPARDLLFSHGADPNPMPALKNADALLLTSLHDAWPTVILEAFDLGIPVLSLDCPSGPAEMIGRQMERGVLCKDVQDMATKIVWLLDGKQTLLRAEMGARARVFLAQFRPDQALPQWIKAFQLVSRI